MREKFVRRGKKAVYFTSPLLDKHGVPHMFCTRNGGVSEGVFASLNFATGKPDKGETDGFENIQINHDIAANELGFTAKDVCRSNQTHSTTIRKVGKNERGTGLFSPRFTEGVDGLITSDPGVLLSVRSADCVPILFYNRSTNTAAAVHAGWRGTIGGITAKAVEMLGDPTQVLAAIGPCAGNCCYEVGEELRAKFTDSDSDFAVCFSRREGRLYLDLTAANVLILTKSGIPDHQISTCELCTCCHPEDFYSHRRDGNARGTMASFIACL